MNKPSKSAETLIGEIVRLVEAGSPVRRRLPDGGRVHIDRRLPFLCVHRRPPDRDDPDTESLLTGEAAYLLASGDSAAQREVSRLVQEVATLQSRACGAFLIVEIWANPDLLTEEDDDGSAPAPVFRILAPRHNAPSSVIERLDLALRRVRLRRCCARVKVDYVQNCAPPGMKPLLTAARLKATGSTLIGLEIAPVYRDRESGERLPYALRAVRQGVGRALKQGFYEFARQYSRHKPVHYHELGRRAMTRAVYETDRQLAAIDEQFDLILQATPVNVASAWHRFRHKRFAVIPEFHYRPRTVDPGQVKRALYNIPLDSIEDPTLALLFEEKRRELDRKISMLDARGKPEFLYGSMQVFGVASDPLLEAARTILEKVAPHTHDDKRSRALDAVKFAELARAELDHYRKTDPSLAATVQIRDDISGLIVSQGHFLVGSDVKVGENRVDASLQHEVGVHLVTYYNGLVQPLRQLHMGLAAYDETQEGLAVLAEYLVGGLNRSRLRTLAARVVAVQHLVAGADFIETYRTLHHEYEFSQYQAYYIAMRVYRGGGLTKDVVYLRGLIDLLSYFERGGDMDVLLTGKFALQQAPFIEELHWRKVIRPPLLRPRFLAAESCRERLDCLRAGLDLPSLIEGVAA
ncbi:MAG TPA: flavohemoglobin expression-modulating QEGLA motif protein [Gammaproteobacteria bacterium]|nr:flavohemoglobin expression-modulating QEGLA motif protein [Gammaproteobacteria bacterium]